MGDEVKIDVVSSASERYKKQAQKSLFKKKNTNKMFGVEKPSFGLLYGKHGKNYELVNFF